jgi:hypothetical protein
MAHNPTSAARQSQPETETQPKTESRETQPLAPWAEAYEGATCIRLSFVSYKEANGKYKSTFGGLMAGYTDPVSGQPCFFVGKDGSRIAGSVSVRIFGDEAEQFMLNVGTPGVAEDLMLEIKPDAKVSVYRNDEGEVQYLALRADQLTLACDYVASSKKLEFKRGFGKTA